MANDLTSSPIDRQNVFNNRYALEKIEEHLALGGIEFEGKFLSTKQQLTEMYEVSDTTVKRYLKHHGDELKNNSYQLLKVEKLRKFKELAYGAVIDEGTKTPILGVFDFRAMLKLLNAALQSKAVQVK